MYPQHEHFKDGKEVILKFVLLSCFAQQNLRCQIKCAIHLKQLTINNECNFFPNI